MLKTLVANTSEIVWIKTFDQHYLLLEGAVEDILSVTKDSLLNNPGIILNTIHSDDVDKIKSIYSSDIFPATFEYRIAGLKNEFKYVQETVFKSEKYFYGIIKKYISISD